MDFITLIANGVGNIIGSTGIGSKSRQKEIALQGSIDADNAKSLSKTLTKTLVISGVLILVILIIFLTLRKK